VIAVTRSRVVAVVLVAGFFAGCQPVPSSPPVQGSPSTAPSTTSEASPPAPVQTPVAGSISANAETGVGTLSPLLPDQLPLVRITAQVATKTVLTNKQETGWPDLDIAWKDGGCTLLAWYVRHPMSYAPNPPPPSAVYLVQLVDQIDASRSTWVMVDATTGELGSAGYGASSSDCH
jgi:hypothetical protein